MWPSKCTDRSLSIVTSCQLVDKKLAVLDFFGRQKESVLYTPSLFANVGLTGNCKYKTATSQRHAMKYPASLQSTHNPTAQSWVNSWSYNYNSTGELNVRSHRKRSAARRRAVPRAPPQRILCACRNHYRVLCNITRGINRNLFCRRLLYQDTF